jgi:hypothetical protein
MRLTFRVREFDRLENEDTIGTVALQNKKSKLPVLRTGTLCAPLQNPSGILRGLLRHC